MERRQRQKKKKKQIIELGNPFYIKKISKLYKHININNYVLKTAEGAEVTFNNSENPSSNWKINCFKKKCYLKSPNDF